ncbi:MAG: hypothetical protein FWH26_00710 [Oscillospiraceae bacterium]|nr:hypothetical protein [Oscillospiraceae bacterium]
MRKAYCIPFTGETANPHQELRLVSGAFPPQKNGETLPSLSPDVHIKYTPFKGICQWNLLQYLLFVRIAQNRKRISGQNADEKEGTGGAFSLSLRF